MNIRELLDELQEKKDLRDEALLALLRSKDPDLQEELHARARSVAREHFGKEIYLRGLVEWSNACRNDCLYCGIRKSNAAIPRYTLAPQDILNCARSVYEAGIRTVVLQGGENPAGASALAGTVREIRNRWPDMAITLSLGELPFSTYEALREAGADRYLLRHETATPAHYARLHPSGMSLEHRLECLSQLRSLGFQVGMGMMVGSPFQTEENLLADIRLIQSFGPEMIGCGPFIPHKDTVFAGYPAGSAQTTLLLYSILRLMLPDALIPTTTALSSILPDGRIRGIRAGANVIMPSFTPPAGREAYALYDHKAHEALETIVNQLSRAGYSVSPNRGDYKHQA